MSSIKSGVLHSLKWIAISKLIIQAFRWLATFIVIRLLMPDDYAIVAISDMVAGYLLAFSSLGLGALLVSKKKVDLRFMQEMLWLSYIVNISLFIIQFFLAEYIAGVYSNEAVEMVLKASAFCYLLNIFTLIPSSLMVRNMEHKRKSLIEMFAGLTSTISIITLAYCGFGFWSLVYGYIINEVFKAIFYFKYSDNFIFIPHIPRKRSLKLMRYCLSVSLSELIFHIRDSADLLIGGIYLSKAQLGVYNVALQVSNMPLRKLAPPIRAVAHPTLAKYRNDSKRLFGYLTKMQRLGFFITVPLFWGISSTIDLILPHALGAQWSDSINVISLICLALPFRFGEEMLHPVLKGMQRGREMLICNIFGLVVFSACIYVGVSANHGLAGIALAWIVSTPLIYFFSAYIASKALGQSMQTFSNQWISPAVAGVCMVLSIEMIKQYINGSIHPLLILPIVMIVGGVTYLSTILLIKKTLVTEILDFRKA